MYRREGKNHIPLFAFVPTNVMQLQLNMKQSINITYTFYPPPSPKLCTPDLYVYIYNHNKFNLSQKGARLVFFGGWVGSARKKVYQLTVAVLFVYVLFAYADIPRNLVDPNCQSLPPNRTQQLERKDTHMTTQTNSETHTIFF